MMTDDEQKETMKLYQALGVASTIKPQMEIDINKPIEMMLEVVEYVNDKLAELDARRYELDLYKERCAELEAILGRPRGN